jgi:UDP-N-acetylglucosamine/UDP-N-acetylgalactosamine diphosphorylase
VGALRGQLAQYGQEHVLRFWERLDPAGRERLASQASGLDLALVARLAERPEDSRRTGGLEVPKVERLPEHGGDPALRAGWAECGRELLASGQVAALVVAGGQGTRLGFEGPKGALPLGPVSGRSLFEQQAQKLRRAGQRFGKSVPWVVMTSHATDEATRDLFRRERCFGLAEDDVHFFRQASLPALDEDGRIQLEAPDRIALAPDGHGGCFTALEESGVLDTLEARGVTRLAYYQVDNPLVRIADEVFLGMHALQGAEMSLKVVAKRAPAEPAGTLVARDGHLAVIEYTEVPEHEATRRDASGELVFWAMSVGIHLLDVALVRRVASDPGRWLPWHVARKRVACVDADGTPHVPERPNARKHERFVFDALSAARAAAALEVRREDEYAPIKNPTGCLSLESARRALVACYRRWLEEAGVTLPPGDPIVELDQSRIDGPDDVRASGIRDATEAQPVIRLAAGASA